MSQVTLKNDIIPTFEPIDQPRQKRKIIDISSDNEDSHSSTEQTKQTQSCNKRTKADKDMSISSLYTNTSSVTNVPILSKAIANSVVWIAATFSMQDKDEEKQITEQTKEQSATANQIAAFSVYHGLDDTRNIAEKVTLKKDQDLNDVYIMGVEHILEQFKNDPGDLVIHTGCAFLQNCLEEQDNKSTSSTGDNEKHLDNIRTKIAKRNGDTSFTTSSLEEDEFKAALKMAKEKLTEKEDGDVAVSNDSVSEFSPENIRSVRVNVTNDIVAPTQDIDVFEDSKEMEIEQHEIESATEIIEVSLEEAAKELTATEDSNDEDNDNSSVADSSWGSGLSLKSFFDLFKPFGRSKKN